VRRLLATSRDRVNDLLPPGTLSVGIGLAVVGIGSYGYLVLAARALGKTEYAPLSVLWALVFFVGPGFFLPIEQEVGRALASRRAAGIGGRPVVVRAAALGAALLIGLVVVGLAVSHLLIDHLFSDQSGLFVAWLISLVGAYVGYVLRGVMSGVGRFGAYSRYISAEAAIRLVLCVIAAAAGAATAGPFGLALGIAPLLAVVPCVAGERDLLEPGPPAHLREISSALGALLVGSVASMALVNAGPIAMKLLADKAEEDEVGRFLAGLILARVPLFLFQAVQAALLPRLAELAEQGEHDELVAGLRRLLVVLTGIVAVGIAASFAIGPTVLPIVFGGDFDLGRRTLALLALGSGAYLLAAALAQANIALSGHLQMALSWVAGVVGLVVTLLVYRGDLFLRVELSIVVGGVLALVAQAATLVALLRGGREVDAGDLLEALVDSPVQP
jgi:O-antigen/teichoic acid export membrane protein